VWPTAFADALGFIVALGLFPVSERCAPETLPIEPRQTSAPEKQSRPPEEGLHDDPADEAR